MATKALFWTGNKSIVKATDWSRNRSPDREMEMSLEVEVAMWREDLRMREEEARTEQVIRSVLGSTLITPTLSGGG